MPGKDGPGQEPRDGEDGKEDMDTNKGSPMTHEDWLLFRKELRQDLKDHQAKFHQDVKDIHNKLDQHIERNNDDFRKLDQKLGKIETTTGVNTAKIVGIVSLLSLFVAAAVSAGFSHFVG